jgi:Kdo2-lipid IVA lauroyltransferase/acyltransferase
MQAIGYYLALPIIYFFSILPMAILRQLSNVAYFLMLYVFKYRKEVVYRNLRNSFPEKSDAEIKAITKRFYMVLADTLFETFKALTITHKQLKKKCSILNYEIVEASIKKGRNALLVLGHYGNWEWAGGSMAVHAGLPLKAAYKPLSNKYFNRLAVHTRTRLKIVLIPKRQTLKHLTETAHEQTLLVLIADQSPNPKDHYWTKFLNQDTAVVTGMERIARQYDYDVFYATIHHVKRGKYEITFKLLTDDPNSLPPQQLTAMFMKELENDIIQDPGPYLWSHRRWKLKKPIEA